MLYVMTSVARLLSSAFQLIGGLALILGLVAVSWAAIGFLAGIAARAAHFAFWLIA